MKNKNKGERGLVLGPKLEGREWETFELLITNLESDLCALIGGTQGLLNFAWLPTLDG